MSRAQILLVDDDPQVLGLLTRMLGEQGFATTGVADVANARQRLRTEDYELVLLDVTMPGESGLVLLGELSTRCPEVATLMVTALDDVDLARTALGAGAYGYVVKPFDANELLISITNALMRRTLELENRAHREGLEHIVEQRTAALERAAGRLKCSEDDLRQAKKETVQRLMRALELRDEETGLHICRMSLYCGLLADRLGLDGSRSQLIKDASALHDIGKIGVPDWILRKPGPLTPEERASMQRHTEIGYELLAGSKSELLQLAALIALTHHERFDGSGYPRGLAASAIPIEGRIAAVADVFDALTCERPYRSALPLDKAVEIMREKRGRHFDPAVLTCFFDSLDEIVTISRSRGSVFWSPGTASEWGSPDRTSENSSPADRPERSGHAGNTSSETGTHETARFR